MKKRYLISALGLAAAIALFGCGSDKKETETSAPAKQSTDTATQTEADAQTEAAVSSDDSSEDMNTEAGDASDDTAETESETEASIAPITPSDYLVKDASKYVTLGNYDGLEIIQYTYDVTDDMVQQQIDADLQSVAVEEDIDTPSASGDIIYVSLKSSVEGTDSAKANADAASDEADSTEAASDKSASTEVLSDESASTEVLSDESASTEVLSDESASTEALSDESASTGAISDDADDVENTYFTIGNEEYGADFDKELTGLSTGDTKHFSVTFAEDAWVDEDWVGKTVDFDVTVTGVTRLSVPEYNDDYIANYTDYSSKEEYEAAVRKNLEDQYTDISYSDAIESLFQAALDATTFNGYPQELYDACKEDTMVFYRMFAGDDNTSDADILAAFGISEEDIDSEVLTTVYQRLLISAYCEANDITVTQDDYLAYLENNAADYGEANSVSFEEDYGRESLVWALYQSKVADQLYKAAKITKTTYSDDLFSGDFTELQSDPELETEIISDDETSETLGGSEYLSLEPETYSSEDVVDLSETSASE